MKNNEYSTYICPFCGKTYSGERGRFDAQAHSFLSGCGTFRNGPHYLDNPLDSYTGWASGAGTNVILPNTFEWWYSIFLGLENTKEDRKKLKTFMGDLFMMVASYGTTKKDLRDWFIDIFVDPFSSHVKGDYYTPNEEYLESLVAQMDEYEEAYQAIIKKWAQGQVDVNEDK